MGLQRKRLSKREVKSQLKKLKGWKLSKDGKSIWKKVQRKNFVDAVGFVKRIVPVAERLVHHPDVQIIGYNKVIISVTTHDRGGLTDYDFELARRIDKLKI